MKLGIFEKRNIFESIESPKRLVWGPMLPLLAIVILILGQLITLVPVFETGLIAEEDLEKYPNIIYMLFAPFTVICVITALWIRFFEGRSIESSGILFNNKFFRDYSIGYGYGLLMAFIIVYGLWGLGAYGIESDAVFRIPNLFPLIILLIGFMIQSGVEEYLFRGWLFSRLAERYNIFIGIAVNAGLFTLVHLPGVDFANTSTTMLAISIAMSILFSIFLSLMVLKQKSIWGAAAWHAAWNWIFINGFGLATTGIELNINPIIVDLKAIESAPLWLSGGTEGPEGSILTVIILVIGCALIVGKKIIKA